MQSHRKSIGSPLGSPLSLIGIISAGEEMQASHSSHADRGGSYQIIFGESGDISIQVHLYHERFRGVGKDGEGDVVRGRLALTVGDSEGVVVGPVDQV